VIAGQSEHAVPTMPQKEAAACMPSWSSVFAWPYDFPLPRRNGCVVSLSSRLPPTIARRGLPERGRRSAR
jgi:hypothetical protein